MRHLFGREGGCPAPLGGRAEDRPAHEIGRRLHRHAPANCSRLLLLQPRGQDAG